MITPCISTTLVLVLLGTVVFFVAMGVQLSRVMKENFSLSLMLDDGITQAEAYGLQQRLRAEPYVRLTSYVSKEKASREQAEAMGADPAEFMGYSPVPASFEVYLNADYTAADSLAKIVPALQADEHVIEVVYPQELMETVNANIRRVSVVLLVIAVLLTFVSFSLINNTMRLSVYASRFLIHTMKLVGAKWSFIRRPFMLNAFGIALVSVLAAEAVLVGLAVWLVKWEPDVLRVLDWRVAAVTTGVVAAAGLLMTMLCAYFSVNKHLRMSGNSVYKQ